MTDEPPTATKTFPTHDEMQATFDAYAAAVGRLAYHWNLLHEKFGRLFAVVTGMDRQIAFAIWYSTDSDRTQQSMLKAAIIAGFYRWLNTKPPHATDDLIWLMNEANSLADYRNTAVHMPVNLYINIVTGGPAEMGPAWLQGHPRAKRSMGKRLLDELKWYDVWAETLIRFTDAAEHSLQFVHEPWPEKPQRPSHGHRSDRQAPQPRQPRPKSQRQRRSSLA